MRGEKGMIKRKIVAIQKYGTTNRGNPKSYWIVLECGHVYVTSHSPSISIDDFMLHQNLNPTKRCKECERNKPVDLEMLKQFTPYKVWNEQNFSRFEESV